MNVIFARSHGKSWQNVRIIDWIVRCPLARAVAEDQSQRLLHAMPCHIFIEDKRKESK